MVFDGFGTASEEDVRRRWAKKCNGNFTRLGIRSCSIESLCPVQEKVWKMSHSSHSGCQLFTSCVLASLQCSFGVPNQNCMDKPLEWFCVLAPKGLVRHRLIS